MVVRGEQGKTPHKEWKHPHTNFPLPLRNCGQCGNEIPEDRLKKRQVKFCSRQCYLKAQSDKYRARNIKPRAAIPPGTMGTIAELRVSADLLLQGYEVFRALSPSCSCDLAIIKNGELKRIEVKTGHYDAKGNPYRWHTEKELGKYDIYALVLPDKIIYYPEITALTKSPKGQ